MGKIPNSYAIINSEMLFLTEDEELRRFLGQGSQDMFSLFLDYMHADDREAFRNAVREVREHFIPKNATAVRLADKDGNYCWAFITISASAKEWDDTEAFQLHVTDPDDDTEQLLEDSIAEYQAYFELISAILFSYDADAGRIYVFTRNAGQQIMLFDGALDKWQEEMSGKVDPESMAALTSFCRDLQMKRGSFSYTLKTSAFSNEGKMEECLFKAHLVTERGGEKILGFIQPVERQGEALSNLEYTRDTGIPALNKKSIIDYAKRSMSAGGNKVCLVILDLDNFKTVNDTLGHMVGDEVLLRSAQIIKAVLGDRGVLGRIGGDEMMIVFPQLESETELRNTLRSIRTNIEWEYQDKWEGVKVTCSMGAAVYPDNGNSYDEIFSLADKMLYIAKSKGKNRYVIFVPELHSSVLNPGQKTMDEIMKEVVGDRNGVMQQITELFLMRHAMTEEQVLNSVGTSFHLDEIIYVSGERFRDCKMKVWNHEGYQYNLQDPVYCSPDPELLASFDENNMLVFNAISGLEAKSEALYHKLKDSGVESALFYKFSAASKDVGYLIFSKKSRRQMWSEEDKVLLALVGKIIELSRTT